MAGSSFGNIFRITTWGESHGSGVGVVIDGCPAGLKINEELIQNYMNKGKASASPFSKHGKGNNFVAIHSGVYNGTTTGTPISVSVTNSNIISSDYPEIQNLYRPGYADYSYNAKFGIRDCLNSRQTSELENVARVAAGAIAVEILKNLGVSICTYVSRIGSVGISYQNASLEELYNSPLNMPDPKASQKAEEYLAKIAEEGDTAGGVVECLVSDIPAGIGEPVFEKLDANLSKAVMSIDSIKGFEIGSGFESAGMKGSESNDSFYRTKDGKIGKKTNNAGGILGGISDGSEIVLRAGIRAVPSISRKQQTVDTQGNETEIALPETTDICIVPRACAIIEAMTAITLVDMLFENMSSKIDKIRDFYQSDSQSGIR